MGRKGSAIWGKPPLNGREAPVFLIIAYPRALAQRIPKFYARNRAPPDFRREAAFPTPSQSRSSPRQKRGRRSSPAVHEIRRNARDGAPHPRAFRKAGRPKRQKREAAFSAPALSKNAAIRFPSPAPPDNWAPDARCRAAEAEIPPPALADRPKGKSARRLPHLSLSQGRPSQRQKRRRRFSRSRAFQKCGRRISFSRAKPAVPKAKARAAFSCSHAFQ